MIVTRFGVRLSHNVIDHRLEPQIWQAIQDSIKGSWRALNNGFPYRYKRYHLDNLTFELNLKTQEVTCYIETIEDCRQLVMTGGSPLTAGLMYKAERTPLPSQSFDPINKYYNVTETEVIDYINGSAHLIFAKMDDGAHEVVLITPDDKIEPYLKAFNTRSQMTITVINP